MICSCKSQSLQEPYAVTFAKENEIYLLPTILSTIPSSYEDLTNVCALGHEVLHAADANLGRFSLDNHEWKGLDKPLNVSFIWQPKNL